MTDDRFDRELAARLRAYESRIPDAPAPVLDGGRRRRSGLPLLLAGGTAALAAVALAMVVMLGWERQQVGGPDTTPSPSPSAGTSATPEPAASATPAATPSSSPSLSPSATEPSAAPSESPQPGMTDLAWSVTGSFPSDGAGPSMVQHVVAVEGGYVAVGVSYELPLPNVGPTPPHTLRTWLSADGRAWEQVEAGLENVEFTSLVVRMDGLLLATGRRGTVGAGGYLESEELGAWTSPDGRTWGDASISMPTVPSTIVRGGRGYLALVRPDPTTEEFELWHSPDGTSWIAVHDGMAISMDLGAGDEGFVVVGRTADESDESFALASGDGREWFDASNPPNVLAHVAALGGDWIAMSAFGADGNAASGDTWWSPNGLEWAEHGQAPTKQVEVDGAACDEFIRHLHSAGRWLVAGTDLGGPCSEGGFAVHGTQLISTDGAAFTSLPFETGTPGQSRSGALVSAAATEEGGLVLGGELDGVATFWLGTEQ